MDDYDMSLGLFGIMLCMYAGYKIKQRSQGRRRFKVRPINRSRKTLGGFNYYKNMKISDPEQFFKYTRMSVPVFEKLLGKVRPHIRKQFRSDGILPEERLIVTLQYLSQGTSMQALAWNFHMGHATVHQIIHDTCKALWKVLNPDYLKSPDTKEEWMNICDGFNKKWNFPHCLGAIDGKHIKIQAPPKSGSLYYNYKNTFSIVLLATCDSEYKFTCVDIGAYGSQSDGGIFRNSVFGERMEENNLGIPQDEIIEETNVKLPFFLVGDEAFPLKKYIMRPYPGKNLTQKQKKFNYRLSRARQVIENTFGILVARWRILKTTINANVDNIDHIVKAVVVLHNYCQKEHEGANMYCPANYVDTDGEENGGWRSEQEPLVSVGRLGANVAKRSIYGMRDCLADYFQSEQGKVPWQNKAIDLL